MTPGARVSAAIEILDSVTDGAPVEAVLTRWARNNRFAGSKDRAAIRDHVFDVMRQFKSSGFAGAGHDGRALMIGQLRLQGEQLDALFNGVGHAPAALAEADQSSLPDLDARPAESALDMPAWVFERLEADLGSPEATSVAQTLRHRAPLFLRTNPVKGTIDSTLSMLVNDGFKAAPVAGNSTALRVSGHGRGLRNSEAFQEGLVELQDASSQAMVNALPLKDGMRVLDYCAGGGGKSLAMGCAAQLTCVASDISTERMQDIPERARRAGIVIDVKAQSELDGTFDLVLIDAPCSGSGTWRRAPQAKWLLTPEALSDLEETQFGILETASKFVKQDGILAYGTCSVFSSENADIVARFLENTSDFKQLSQSAWMPSENGDGFALSVLQRT